MLKMQAILMAHRMPSRHSEATSGSSQSCSPTLKAASKGVHASCNTQKYIYSTSTSDILLGHNINPAENDLVQSGM